MSKIQPTQGNYFRSKFKEKLHFGFSIKSIYLVNIGFLSEIFSYMAYELELSLLQRLLRPQNSIVS